MVYDLRARLGLAAERLVSTGAAAPSLSVEVGVVEPLMARYIPNWLPLADVPAFIGASEIDICKAMTDGAIAVRVTIGVSRAGYGGAVFEHGRVDVPDHLRPDDLDWEQSRPRSPWYIEPSIAESYLESGWPRRLPIGLLELSTDDLVGAFEIPQTTDVRRADDVSSVSPMRMPDEAGGCGDPPVTAEQFRLAEDVLPLLVEWAKWRYGGQATPSRDSLLDDHRADYGVLPGISEPVMRKLRRERATTAEKRGGAPNQSRHR